MKKVFLLLTGLASFTLSKAQLKQGTIYYEQKVNMHRNIQNEQMKAMVPEFRTNKYQLEFSDSISMYKLVPADETPDPFAGSGNRTMTFNFSASGGGDTYKNFAQMRSVQANELQGKNFLIIDSIRQIPWKIGTETKQILGYTCHKATRKFSLAQGGGRRIMMSSASPGAVIDTTSKTTAAAREVEVVAWYAEDIQSPAGPESYCQLPGVVLQVDVDNGATVYTATEIKKTVDLKNLKEPKKGKVVTQQEYLKTMMEMMGGNMNMSNGGSNVIRFGGGGN